jgi:hypothetical protein
LSRVPAVGWKQGVDLWRYVQARFGQGGAAANNVAAVASPIDAASAGTGGIAAFYEPVSETDDIQLLSRGNGLSNANARPAAAPADSVVLTLATPAATAKRKRPVEPAVSVHEDLASQGVPMSWWLPGLVVSTAAAAGVLSPLMGMPW